MRCEIIAVGTELLLGQIVDSNSSWMGEHLALAGIDSHFQTKVGDNLERMIESIRIALARSDAVIMCGGLGPTQDDITREAIAAIMGVSLIRWPEIGEHIRAMFEQRGRQMAPSNLRQADVPDGASTIKEMPGTAPGLICPVGQQVIYAVPGVPHEMRTMLNGTVLPDLQRRAGVTSVIRSRVLRTWGYTESGLADLLADRIDELDRLGNPTLAFQASGIEGIKVRITAKAGDDEAAEAMLAAEEAGLRPMLERYVFGTDGETMESAVLDLLRQKGLSLAVAETVSGGLAGSRLSAVSESAEVFAGSVLCPSPEARSRLLGMPDGPLITPEAAKSMATGVRQLLGADVGLAATGVLGPEIEENQVPGTVWLGLAFGDGAEAVEVKLPGDANRVRQYSVISLLNLLRLRLLGLDAKMFR
ncbi:MAG: CinA family nicotinamide mononucleotide deamidase-related protein [Geminicoccaceae bacterium]